MTKLRPPDSLRPLLLVVDDHDGLREAVSQQLRDEGYDIVAIERADQALALLRAVRVAAVLSDFEMPNMNGLRLLQALRSTKNMTPFVLWSTDLPTEAAQRAQSLGAKIASKTDMTTLLPTIEQALNESPPPSPKATPKARVIRRARK